METPEAIVVALVAASAAIMGALVTQLVAILRYVVGQRRKRYVLCRKKYEALALLVASSHQWFTDLLKTRSRSELSALPPFDARHAMTLAHLYFPELRGACQNYVNRCAEFQVMLIELNEGRNDYDAGTQAAHRDQGRFIDASQELHRARDTLDKAIIKHAAKYTRA